MWKYSVSIGQINVNNKQRQINVVCTTAWSKKHHSEVNDMLVLLVPSFNNLQDSILKTEFKWRSSEKLLKMFWGLRSLIYYIRILRGIGENRGGSFHRPKLCYQEPYLGTPSTWVVASSSWLSPCGCGIPSLSSL